MIENVTTEPPTKRRHWLWAVAAIVLIGGWIAYMLVLYGSTTARLPDGSSITFLEFIEPKNSRPEGINPLNSNEYELKPKKTAWESVWKRLPSSLQRHLPVPLSKRGISRNFSCASKQALWFEVSPAFNEGSWRFFWVDDEGYESETWPFSFNHDSSPGKSKDTSWIAFEGCVPRDQKHLHLRVRSREGESEHQPWEQRANGKLGQVVAEMKIRNALHKSAPAPPLTPQILPVKAACHDHTLNLTRVVRSRVVSHLTGGLRFEMNVDGHEPAHRRYSFYDWLVEDSKSNIAYWPKSTLYGGAEVVGIALWNDSQVWRVRFRALRNLDSDYTSAEKVTFQRVPVPAESLGTTPAELYQEELTLLGRKVRLDDVQSEGTSAVSFCVTVSPRMEKHALVMLHAADAQGDGGLPASNHAATYREPLQLVGFVDNHPDNGLIYKGRVPRPATGNHLTITFGADEGVPVEFSFRPEFEP